MEYTKWNDPLFGSKIVFDLSYFALINIVSLNIIFGIIIDTFAELRDEQNTREDDLHNICFICGHTRDQFEKEGINFNNHIKYSHSPLLYANYLIYLKTKPSDQFNGIEEYVYSQYLKGNTNWVPIKKTDCIKVEIDDTDFKLDRLRINIESQREEAM